MLPKNQRLKKSDSFDNVFRAGSRWKGRHLLCLAVANQGTQMRVGVVVTKKIDKRATERNYLRRFIAHTTRGLVASYNLPRNYDIVVVVTRVPTGNVAANLRSDLGQWLKSLPSR